MRVFISWSKERSLRVAKALNDWLPQVINQVEPWMSAESIESGKLSIAQISEALETTNFGIICVTPENQHETWLNFEAGALSKAVHSANASAIPLLTGFNSFGQLGAPLNSYQAHMSTKGDLKKIVHAINDALGTSKRPETQLEAAFEKWWPDLEEDLLAAAEWAAEDRQSSQETMSTEMQFEQVIQAVKTLQLQVEELTATVRIQIPHDSRARRAAMMRMLAEERFDDAVTYASYSEGTVHEVRNMLAAAGHDKHTMMIGGDGVVFVTDELPSPELQRAIIKFIVANESNPGRVSFATYDDQ